MQGMFAAGTIKLVEQSYVVQLFRLLSSVNKQLVYDSVQEK